MHKSGVQGREKAKKIILALFSGIFRPSKEGVNPYPNGMNVVIRSKGQAVSTCAKV
jgi:hypothetical protein